MTRSNTYFIDIDGTILKHKGSGASWQWLSQAEVLPGAVNFLNDLEAGGHHIVLVTGRPEHYRSTLVKELANHGIVYHQLVMGITSGTRIVINDQKPSGEKSCMSFSVPRNSNLMETMS